VARRDLSVDRAPLVRFVPLQHTLVATRCPGLPGSGTIPLRRSHVRQPAPHFARADLLARDVPPLRFYAVSGAKRRRSTWRTRGVVHRSTHVSVAPRFSSAAAERRREQTTFRRRSDRPCGWDRGNRMATFTVVRPHASAVASIRRPSWVMHRRVPSARCSATHQGSGLLATWPVRRRRSSLCSSPGGAHGVRAC
jgi:hypothetical protein